MPRFHRVTFDGTLAQGVERWSTSFAYEATTQTAPDPGALSGWAGAIMAGFAGTGAGVVALKSFLSSSGQLTRVRIYSYPDPGVQADVSGQSTAAPISGTGAPSLPPQCSAVLSLRTGLPGAARRGRAYWPLCGGAVSAGQTTTLVSQTVVSNIAQWLRDISDLESGDAGRLAVASVSLGAVTPVTSLVVDTVIDTQRRRRDAMVGTTYTASVPA